MLICPNCTAFMQDGGKCPCCEHVDQSEDCGCEFCTTPDTILYVPVTQQEYGEPIA